jgi:hypothetical protein
VLAFRDCFHVVAIWFVIVFFALFLMPKPKLEGAAPAAARMAVNPDAA